MRLIDVDALKSNLGLSNDCRTCKIGVKNNCQLETFGVYGICTMLDDAPTVSGWVSVKDRMPDKPCGCLVFNIYGCRALDFWEGDGWAISDENEITHWMPLPPGPEVDK